MTARDRGVRASRDAIGQNVPLLLPTFVIAGRDTAGNEQAFRDAACSFLCVTE